MMKQRMVDVILVFAVIMIIILVVISMSQTEVEIGTALSCKMDKGAIVCVEQ